MASKNCSASRMSSALSNGWRTTAVPCSSSTRICSPVADTPSGGPSDSSIRPRSCSTRSGETSVNRTTRMCTGVLLLRVGPRLYPRLGDGQGRGSVHAPLEQQQMAVLLAVERHVEERRGELPALRTEFAKRPLELTPVELLLLAPEEAVR